MNAIILTLIILLVWVSLYAIYWNMVRPVALTKFQFLVNTVSDELDMLLLSGKLSPKDEAARVLRKRTEKAQMLIPAIDVTTILLAKSYGHMVSRKEVQEEEATLKSAGDVVAALSWKLDLAVVGAFAANSPFLVGALVTFLLGCAMFSAAAKNAQQWMTRFFWNAIYARPVSVNAAPAHAAAY